MIKFAEINANPPPRAFTNLWALLSLGLSGKSFLKGFIIIFVKKKLKKKLINKLRVNTSWNIQLSIFKIINTRLKKYLN